jgi:Rnl2 family RNA ligase
MASKYVPYSSIDKYRERNLYHFYGKECVLTEKIHGSNFQLWCESLKNGSVTIRAGKRSGFIGEEKFFNHSTIIEKYTSNIIEMIPRDGSPHQIRIIGEYFGGSYHGKCSPGACSIQKGKYANYSSTNDFAVFDIVIDGIWQTWDKVKELCNTYGLIHVPEVIRGIWEEINVFDVENFKSILSEQINKDGIQNPAEGVVIRLIDPGEDCTNRDNRVKWKCGEMIEGVPRERSITSNKSEVDEKYIGMMDQSRFDSYFSKVGPDVFTDRNIGMHLGMIIEDILSDIQELEGNISKDQKKIIRKSLIPIARRFIINYMQNS